MNQQNSSKLWSQKISFFFQCQKYAPVSKNPDTKIRIINNWPCRHYLATEFDTCMCGAEEWKKRCNICRSLPILHKMVRRARLPWNWSCQDLICGKQTLFKIWACVSGWCICFCNWINHHLPSHNLVSHYTADGQNLGPDLACIWWKAVQLLLLSLLLSSKPNMAILMLLYHQDVVPFNIKS